MVAPHRTVFGGCRFRFPCLAASNPLFKIILYSFMYCSYVIIVVLFKGFLDLNTFIQESPVLDSKNCLRQHEAYMDVKRLEVQI